MIATESLILKPHKRRTQYSIEINGDANIVLRTPISPSNTVIQKILTDHRQWIEKHQQKQQQINASLANWNAPNHIHIRGKMHRINYSNAPTIVKTHDTIWLPAHTSLKEFLQTAARDYLPNQCQVIAHIMGLSPSAIKIRRMRSCWGTCHSNKTITLSQSLIHTPDWVSDYVMIHECAHLVHFNHSTAFWKLVNTHTPYVKDAKLWLKHHQGVLGRH